MAEIIMGEFILGGPIILWQDHAIRIWGLSLTPGPAPAKGVGEVAGAPGVLAGAAALS